MRIRFMKDLRALTTTELKELSARGCFAEDWSRVRVSECFSPSQVAMSRFGGRVEIEAGAQIFNSTVINYRIGASALIDRVSLLECVGQSSFGNGVGVASLNENGGRTIKIFDALTSQVAYIATIYRDRPALIDRLESMVDAYSNSKSSDMGSVGCSSKIIASGIIRNLRVASGVVIEGVSHLSNGTILEGAYFGADVKAHDFVAVEGSRVDSGAIIERCFIGENVIVASGFTAVDSLFFASSHLENGEAVSVFGGPYTVSHHKSSLLIAGMFSFFNAGSGSNQSNHLFKCGPVHQGVHLRGCKFGSSAYVMLPALDGAYTSVIGSHSTHHDTSDFPFSYLVNKEGRSTLIPAANISSYGYLRDIEKWVKRDKRRVKRDIVSFEEFNPYITGSVISAVNVCNTLIEKSPESQNYVHRNVAISANNLKRGLGLYNKFAAASLGAMLSQGDLSQRGEGYCRWIDLGGQYITKKVVDALLDSIEQGSVDSFEAIEATLQSFASSYDAYAYDYALGILSELLGHAPSEVEVQQTIEAAAQSRQQIREMALRDMQRDSSLSMAISYGLDSDSAEQRAADFNSVRSL